MIPTYAYPSAYPKKRKPFKNLPFELLLEGFLIFTVTPLGTEPYF